MQDAIIQFIEKQGHPQSEIMEKLRKVVIEHMPNANEFIYHNSLCYTFSKSSSVWIIYLSPTQGHIRFGFSFGSHLPDPEKLLEGVGKRMRHIKIRTLQDALNPALAHLVKEAWENAQVSIPKSRRKKKL